MTAAMKGSATAPMTVARGGGGKEGFSSSIKTTFSSRNAFKGFESKPRAMSMGAKNTLGREISVGRQDIAPRTPVATHFSNPDRSSVNQGVRVNVDYQGSLLNKGSRVSNTPERTSAPKATFPETKPLITGREQVTDKAGSKSEAVKALRGKDYVTVFDSKTMGKGAKTSETSSVITPKANVENKATVKPVSSVDTKRVNGLREAAMHAATANIAAKPRSLETARQADSTQTATKDGARSATLKETAAKAAKATINTKLPSTESKAPRVNNQPDSKPTPAHIRTAPEVRKASEIVTPDNTKAPVVAKVPEASRSVQTQRSMSEIGLSVVRNQTPETGERVGQSQTAAPEVRSVRNNEAVLTQDVSLSQVREALQQVKNPQIVTGTAPAQLVRQPERVVTQPVSPYVTREVGMHTRKAAPLDILKQRESQIVKPRINQAADTPVQASRLQEIERSIDEPREMDKTREKQILTRYISEFVFIQITNITIVERSMQQELARRMATKITTRALMDPGSQLESQLLGDPAVASEQVMFMRIQELVSEARVKIILAKISGVETEVAEQKAMKALHTKIQTSGMKDMFEKVKLSLMSDLMKDATQMPDVKEAPQTEAEEKKDKIDTTETAEAVEDHEAEKEEDEEEEGYGEFNPALVERDPIADEARRETLRKAAERAFADAAREERHVISEAEIVDAVDNPQEPILKSEPVRYDNGDDYSMKDTIEEFEQSDKPVESVEQAEAIIKERVDRIAPVRVRRDPTEEIRPWEDLLRVFGYHVKPKDVLPQAA